MKHQRSERAETLKTYMKGSSASIPGRGDKLHCGHARHEKFGWLSRPSSAAMARG